MTFGAWYAHAVDVGEAAEILGIPVAQVDALAEAGFLDRARVGSISYFSRASIRRFMAPTEPDPRDVRRAMGHGEWEDAFE